MGGFSTAVMPPNTRGFEITPPDPYANLRALAMQGQLAEQKQQIATQQQAMQTAGLQQQELQMNLNQRRAVNQAFQDAFVPDANGVMSLDKNKFVGAVSAAGYGEAALPVAENLTKYQSALEGLKGVKITNAEHERDAAGAIGAIVKSANGEPAVLHTLLTEGINQGALDANEYAPIDKEIQFALQKDPTGAAARQLVNQYADRFIAGSKQQQQEALQKEQAGEAKAKGEEATAAAGKAKTETERLNLQTAALRNPTIQSMLESQIDSVLPVIKGGIYVDENNTAKQAVRSILASGQPDALEKAQAAIKDSADRVGRMNAGVAQAKAQVPIKIEQSLGTEKAKLEAAGATEDDFARAGEQYARTGIMPPLGMTQTARLKVAHYAQEWARDNGFSPADMVGIQAAYKGDVGSLVNFQKNRDQIVSFEQTAQKNLDLALAKAKPLWDAHSPLLNKPLRSIDRTLLGGEDQAAFDAALLVARNEIAKVTSGGGLGGVLSDTARAEVSKAVNPNATLGQIFASAQVMRQDMANRHGSMDATLQDIRGRMTGQPGAPPPSGAKTYTQADIDDAAKQYRMSGAEIERSFQQKGWRKAQ